VDLCLCRALFIASFVFINSFVACLFVTHKQLGSELKHLKAAAAIDSAALSKEVAELHSKLQALAAELKRSEASSASASASSSSSAFGMQSGKPSILKKTSIIAELRSPDRSAFRSVMGSFHSAAAPQLTAVQRRLQVMTDSAVQLAYVALCFCCELVLCCVVLRCCVRRVFFFVFFFFFFLLICLFVCSKYFGEENMRWEELFGIFSGFEADLRVCTSPLLSAACFVFSYCLCCSSLCVLCCAVLCCAVLCCVVLCCVVI
jgi:hypothetical protein